MASAVPTSGNIPQKMEEITIPAERTGKREEIGNPLEAPQKGYERPAGHEDALVPTSINKFPSEILDLILRLAIIDTPTHVRRLLLVCKHWHRLVMDDPQMWNTIRLKIPENCWDVKSWANSALVFLRSCLERSRSTLLHISLDFDHLRTFKLQREIQMGAVMWDGSPQNYAHSHSLELLRREESQDESIVVCKPDHALGLVKELAGPEGINTARWQSLEVVFPSRELAPRMWNVIAHPFPNLTRVSLIKLFRAGNVYSATVPSPHQFPRVEHLVLDVGNSPDFLSQFLPTLRNLSIKAPFERALTHQLSRFTQLSVLTLNEGMRKTTTEASSRLSLPLLEELNLIGTFQPTVAMDLDLPRLRRLVIEWSWRFSVSNTLPVVRPSIVQWAPYDKPQGKSECRLATAVMQDFLLHFTGSMTFSAPLHMKDGLFDLLRVLSSDGLLSTAEWEMVALHEDGEVVETVQISEILVVQQEETT